MQNYKITIIYQNEGVITLTLTSSITINKMFQEVYNGICEWFPGDEQNLQLYSLTLKEQLKRSEQSISQVLKNIFYDKFKFEYNQMIPNNHITFQNDPSSAIQQSQSEIQEDNQPIIQPQNSQEIIISYEGTPLTISLNLTNTTLLELYDFIQYYYKIRNIIIWNRQNNLSSLDKQQYLSQIQWYIPIEIVVTQINDNIQAQKIQLTIETQDGEHSNIMQSTLETTNTIEDLDNFIIEFKGLTKDAVAISWFQKKENSQLVGLPSDRLRMIGQLSINNGDKLVAKLVYTGGYLI